MFINELAEPTLLVIYPGRFQPFHKGHHAVYEYLTGKFGRNNVYIATSNKTDNLKSPFTFAEKAYFMQLTGVPADRIVQATNPYQIESILATSNVTVANPENTVVIFAVSEKDMAEDPRFSFKTKKDGTAPYFQPLKNIKDTQSMKQHGYIMTVPTFDFTVLGQPMRSASELRKLYADSDAKTQQGIIADLFGRYTQEAEQIMNSKLSVSVEPVSENFNRAGNNPLRDKNDYYQKLDYLQRQLNDPALRDMRDQINDRIAQLQKAASMSGFINEEPLGEGRFKDQDIAQQEWDSARRADQSFRRREQSAGEEEPVGDFRVVRRKDGQWLDIKQHHSSNQAFKHAQNLKNKYPSMEVGVRWPNGTVNPMGLSEDAGGVGVVASKKQARDPRYSTSLTKDVRPGQIQKSLRAFKLAEQREPYQQAVDKLTVHWIERMSAEIDEIKQRIGTEQLPADYKEKLKQRIEKLKAERDKLLFNA